MIADERCEHEEPVEPAAGKLDLTLVRLVLTCPACPSQWDGFDAAGNYYYIRYRGGWLAVEKAATRAEWWHGRSATIFTLDHRDGLDGAMDHPEMLQLTGITVVET